MQFRRSASPEVQINIAPLVDVVFLLVIFFAVSTTFLENAGLELTLPNSSSSADVPRSQVSIVVTAAGLLYLDGEQVDEQGLSEQLSERLAAMEQKLVVLEADTETPHGKVVRVMDIAREAGATDLNIAAKRSPE